MGRWVVVVRVRVSCPVWLAAVQWTVQVVVVVIV